MSKYSQYFAIEKQLKQIGYSVDRTDVIHKFTKGFKTSLKDLSSFEYRELCNWLNSVVSQHSENEKRMNLQLKKMRSQILNDATYVGIKEKTGWERFNNFMLTCSILKKPLNRYSITELSDLAKQFKSIRHKYDCYKIVPGSKPFWEQFGGQPGLN